MKQNKKQQPVQKKKASLTSNRRFRLLSASLLFAVLGTTFLMSSFANPTPHDNRELKPFVEDRQRGLVWKDLEKNPNLCPQGYYMASSAGASPQSKCSHGPDPAPEGLDATKSVEPLSTDAIGTVQATSGIVCDGDGISGNRVELIYARASDVPDRYAAFAASFQVYASNMNNAFVESGDQSGSPRSIRFVTDAGCNVVVRNEVLSPTGDDSFSNTRNELTAKGYNSQQRKYNVWTDSNVYCGIANIYNDSTPLESNRNNFGPTFGRTDSGCWGGSVEVHELVHTIGGVQNDAPHTSGGYHCNDNYDRLCYSDGGPSSAVSIVCSDSTNESRLDCNKDDYFNSSPSIPATNYLASHWNVANSLFLLTGRPAGTTTPPPPSSDITLPTVSIINPVSGSLISSKVNITATAQDNVGIVKTEVYIDNKLVQTGTTGTITYGWNSRRVSVGQHTVTIKAFDAANNAGQATLYLVKQ